MKFTMKLFALIFGVLILGNVSDAQSPREQLTQMVEQLQKNPTDSALREKIIKLAQEIKPAPAVPEEAIEFEGRAQFVFNNAKSIDDYLAAAREYEKAVANAPWVPGYYVDLCTIYEKAGKFEEAKRNCEFSLIGLVDSAQITDIKRRIAGLKYGIEQNSPSAVAERKKNQNDEFLRKLDGARFVRRGHSDMYGGYSSDWMDFFEIRRNKVFHGQIIEASNDPNDKIGKIDWDKVSTRAGSKENDGYLITGREFVIPKDDDACQRHQQTCFDEIQTISEDGNKITYRVTINGKTREYIYLRGK